MTLIRQISLLLFATLLFALAGGMAFHLLSLRQALESQLAQRNDAGAQNVALALARYPADRSRMAAQAAGHFATGQFAQLRVVDAAGGVVFDRGASSPPRHAPAWFVQMLPIEAAPAHALVSTERALGSVSAAVPAWNAHDELWGSALRAARLLLTVSLGVALAAALLLLLPLRRQLDATLRHAQAIAQGAFPVMNPARVPELARLVAVLNAIGARVKTLLDAQSAQIESLRQQAHHDPLTDVANRRHFLRQLDAALRREDGPSDAGLVLLRLSDPAGINRLHGHAVTDRALLATAQALQVYPQQVPGCFIGRLNGSDFALCLPAAGVARETGEALAQALAATLPAFGAGVSVVIGSVEIRRAMSMAQCMGAVDGALAQAECRGPFAAHHAEQASPAGAPRGERSWRRLIASALEGKRMRLMEFELVDRAGQLLQLDCPLRLQLEEGGPYEPAAGWLPHAVRGRLTAGVDTCAVSLALQASLTDGRARCVNIAAASLADSGFAHRLGLLLEASPQAARCLRLEVNEAALVEHFLLLQGFGRQLRPLGIRLGIEHASERLAQIEQLYEAGLDYVKLDSTLTRGVARDPRAAALLRTTVTMLRALALQVYAEGVDSEPDAVALWACGVDGMTGPWVSARVEVR